MPAPFSSAWPVPQGAAQGIAPRSFFQTLLSCDRGAPWVGSYRARVPAARTRQNAPGLRTAQKYAFGASARQSPDGPLRRHLIKETNPARRLDRFRCQAAHGCVAVPVEVEGETLDELRQALDAGAEMALRDEVSVDDLRAAVAVNAGHPKGPIKLEASGSVTTDSLPAIAATGVDFVSIGALTKHLRAIDLSMRFE